MPTRLTQLVTTFEVGMAVAGVVLLWLLVLKPRSWARRTAPALPPWDIGVAEFLLFGLFLIGGSFFGVTVASLAGKLLDLRGDAVTVSNGAGAQLGMLAGVLLFWSKRERGPPKSLPGSPNIFLAGAATFLASLPLLLVAAESWKFVLQKLGLPVERQGLIDMFANAESPWLLGVMIALAVAIAPVTEELVFRAGLFRFLRTRMPRVIALVLSALIFAALHVNWVTLEGLSSLAPLVVLAIMFSLAYERTGNIGTSIVAHALFNSNTIMLIFSGVGKE